MSGHGCMAHLTLRTGKANSLSTSCAQTFRSLSTSPQIQRMNRTLRPRKSLSHQNRGGGLPYPEGPPRHGDSLEASFSQLNSGAPEFKAMQLARVDDFVVRALFEPKYTGNRKKLSDNAKFCQQTPSSAVALQVCQMWNMRSKETAADDWISLAEHIWESCLLVDDALERAGLRAEDLRCFQL